MPPRYNRDIEDTLKRKFEFRASKKGKDHRWYELELPGLPAIQTHFSHGNQHIGPDLWKMIANQLRVRTDYLDGMIDCSNTKEAYYKQIKDAPYPPWPDFVLKRLAIPTKKAK